MLLCKSAKLIQYEIHFGLLQCFYLINLMQQLQWIGYCSTEYLQLIGIVSNIFEV